MRGGIDGYAWTIRSGIANAQAQAGMARRMRQSVVLDALQAPFEGAPVKIMNFASFSPMLDHVDLNWCWVEWLCHQHFFSLGGLVDIEHGEVYL